MDIDTAGRLLPAIAGVGIAIAAFALVLWLIKNRKPRLFSMKGDAGGRRLAISDSIALDVRRRLILVRRDNVEHLILTGGPSDLVVETRDVAPAGLANATAESHHTRTPEPPVAHQTHYAPEPKPAPARRSEPRRETQRAPQASTASNEDDYAYGPEAMALSRDYDIWNADERDASLPTPVPQRAQEERRGAAARDIEAEAQEEARQRLNRETAESILEAARQRLMREPAPAQASQPPAQRVSRAPTSAANSLPAASASRENAFSRVLDGRTQAGDIPADQTPHVQPARNWSPTLEQQEASRRAATATSAGESAASRALAHRTGEDAELEERVKLILEELQLRAK